MNVTSIQYKQILGIIILSTCMAQATVPPPPPPADSSTDILAAPPAPTSEATLTPPETPKTTNSPTPPAPTPPPIPEAPTSTPPPPVPPVPDASGTTPLATPSPAAALPSISPAPPAPPVPAAPENTAPSVVPTTPTTPTPVPVLPTTTPEVVTAVASVPASTPVANTPQPLAPSPAVVTAIASTPSNTPVPAFATLKAPSYKAEVDEINSLLQTITATKNHMKELLTSVDADINTAKGLASDARKKSLDILKQSTEEAAKGIDADIQQKLTAITDLRKKVIESTAKAFQEDTNKIQETIKKITGIIEQLKAKGASFQTAQAEAIQKAAAEAATTTKPLPQSGAPSNHTKETKAISAAQEPTIIHYIFHHIASMVNKIVRFFAIFFHSCKEAIWESPAPVVATTAITTPPTSGSTPTQQAPASPTAATIPNKYSFAAHEEGIASLEDTQDKMIQAAHTLEQQINLLGHTLASNKAIGQAIQSDLTLFTPVHQRPAWRQMTETYFGQCLDGITWLCRSMQQTTARAYHAYIEPVFNKVQHDVEKERVGKPNTHAQKSAGLQTIPR